MTYPTPVLALAVVLLAGPAATAADPLVVELWPGKPPRDVGLSDPETTRVYNSPLLDGPTKLVTNVTRPTLTVYLPPREKNTGTAMLICPGGGYHNLFWELEGEEVAAWLTEHGIAGIILKYRCPRRPGDVKGEPPLGPQLDAQRAVSLVRSRAKEWGIDPKKIGMVGFSAGGHLVLATATRAGVRAYDPLDKVDEASCRPDFGVACYSGYLKAKDKDELGSGLRVAADTPPIFLAHAADDSISTPEHSAVMYLALQRAKVPCELHVFASGEHDFGVRRNDKLPASWTGLCLKWLKSRGLWAAK